ncbi:MAG: hypothetical protein GYB67_01605 [Chloroflexi bacterium]|nr:hypothetical protein [Chloroflexota bacterium]
METIENQTFENEEVMVDNRAFLGCTFRRVTLVFASVGLPYFENCNFDTVALAFEGNARNTMHFLSGLFEQDPAGVGAVFAGIRATD